MYKKLTLLLLLLVVVVEPWFWDISRASVWLALIGLILTYCLYSHSKKTLLLAIALFTGIFVWQWFNYRDRALFTVSPVDVLVLNEKRSAFSSVMGKLLVNKPILLVQKIERNLFYNLDPNLYFFANHPRERVGISETPKMLWFLFPFFLVGLFRCCVEKRTALFASGLVALICSSFLSPHAAQGPLLFFPFICLAVFMGIESTFIYLKSKIK